MPNFRSRSKKLSLVDVSEKNRMQNHTFFSLFLHFLCSCIHSELRLSMLICGTSFDYRRISDSSNIKLFSHIYAYSYTSLLKPPSTHTHVFLFHTHTTRYEVKISLQEIKWERFSDIICINIYFYLLCRFYLCINFSNFYGIVKHMPCCVCISRTCTERQREKIERIENMKCSIRRFSERFFCLFSSHSHPLTCPLLTNLAISFIRKERERKKTNSPFVKQLWKKISCYWFIHALAHAV